jgi:hypothetical protein
MNNNLQIRKFDMKSIEFNSNTRSEGPVIVMIGKRGTGKSLLVKDLLSHHRSIPLGCVISGTEIGNHFYQSMVPRMLIHNSYNSVIIENVLKRQFKMIKSPPANIDSRCFLILDDCLYDDKWVRDKLMRLIFMNGRHWKVMLIFTMQYPLGVPPTLRTNIDYTFILRETVIGNRKKLYDNYAGVFPSFDYFCQVLDNTTEDYECLVIKNIGLSNKMEDQVFWYKAEKKSDFRMCPKELWDLSEKMEFNDDDIFSSDVKLKQKNIRVSVNKTN